MNNSDDPTKLIKDINKLSIVLSSVINPEITYSDIINKIVSLKNNGIKISSISIEEDDKTNTKKILIGGVASTRDNLTSFDSDIKADGYFDSIIFPVSDFIKSSDSTFSATLIYKNK